MKRITFIALVLSLCGCYGKKPHTFKTGLEGNQMPGIDLLAADSITHFNTESIKPGKPSILFSFEPWCPYCKAQTRSMLSQISKLKDFNIYMLCTSRPSDLKLFCTKYELRKYPNIQAGIDYKLGFSNYFKKNSIPCLAIYGPDKKLKQVMLGKNNIGSIKEAAFN